MKGLNKTELTGVILLALVIVCITATGLIIKSNAKSVVKTETPVVTLLDSGPDTVAAPAETKKTPKRSEAETKKTPKRSTVKGSKGKKAAKTPATRHDPFSDTVPRR